MKIWYIAEDMLRSKGEDGKQHTLPALSTVDLIEVHSVSCIGLRLEGIRFCIICNERACFLYGRHDFRERGYVTAERNEEFKDSP